MIIYKESYGFFLNYILTIKANPKNLIPIKNLIVQSKFFLRAIIYQQLIISFIKDEIPFDLKK